jgi:hypothetical protein
MKGELLPYCLIRDMQNLFKAKNKMLENFRNFKSWRQFHSSRILSVFFKFLFFNRQTYPVPIKLYFITLNNTYLPISRIIAIATGSNIISELSNTATLFGTNV